MNWRELSQRQHWLIALAVVLLTFGVHVRGLHNDFVEWDDNIYITDNTVIRTISWENVRAMFTEPRYKLYLPLTWLSLSLDYQIWELNPFGYHLTNLILHLANTLLVYLLVHSLVRDRHPQFLVVAAVTAVLFGIHPLRVESVAWATERKDVLFAFFYLASLVVYLRWLTAARAWQYWSCLGLFVLGALSKSTAITLPVVLLLLDYFWKRRVDWLGKVPFVVVSALTALATLAAATSEQGVTVPGADVLPVSTRIGLVGYCTTFYLKKFFWPVHLSAIYPYFDELGWTPLSTAGYVLAFALLLGLAFALRRRWPVVWPAWLFYLVTLSPTIGLVPAGIQVVADRFIYLPSIGLAFAASLGLAEACRARPNLRTVIGSVTGACALGLALLTYQRTGVWANTETLFQSVLADNPDSLPAHIALTRWYNTREQYDKAIQHGRRAVELAPQGLPGRKNLAYALMNAGKYREAIGVLREPIDHRVPDPDIWAAVAKCFTAVGEPANAAAAQAEWRRLTAGQIQSPQ